MYKEKIQELLIEYREDELILDLIHEDLKTMSEYVDLVYQAEVSMPMLRLLKPDTYLDTFATIDKRRRSTHDVCISGIGRLNKFSEKAGLDLFSDVDLGDRYKVGDVIGEIVNEMFKNRK